MKGRSKRTTLELTVAELAPGGSGVAIVDKDGERRAVFLERVVPGDRVRAEVDFTRRPARAEVVERLSPGPDRATSPCAYSDRCGGCDWMHLALDAQSRTHVDHLRAALPSEWRGLNITTHLGEHSVSYRTRARLHVRASGGRAVVGMHAARSHDAVEVDKCVVLHSTLDRSRAEVARFLEGAHGVGEAQIALGAEPTGENREAEALPVLDLRWSGALFPKVYERLEQAVNAKTWQGARVFCGDSSRPATIGDPTPWTAGYDARPLRLPPGGFAQANPAMNVRLVSRVADLVKTALDEGTNSSKKVVELYAGSGNITVALAALSREVIAVESDVDACEAARTNLFLRGLTARIVEGDAATYVVGPATEVLVLDPPRTGARSVIENLSRKRVRHVVYVSCDPPTLGRDLHALKALGYVPRSIEAFEMFPHTSHVEAVVALSVGR